ncbi:hypothetical protein GGE24_007394 [Bradyrhizobium centrosematis]|nr:hypothetical protein [Bradyrhizobium centrosematis]MCS3778019.1 hypothetical protein [Bradyrhizobium centrosematis]
MSRAGSTAATDSDRRHERMVPRTLKGRTANPKGEQDSRRGAPFLPRTARAVSAIVPLTVADLDVAMCVATVTRPRSAIRSNPTRPTAWRQCARIPAPNPFRCREGIAQSAANKCLLALFRAWLICLFEAIYAVCAMPLPCPRCPLTMAPLRMMVGGVLLRAWVCAGNGATARYKYISLRVSPFILCELAQKSGARSGARRPETVILYGLERPEPARG